MKKRLIVLFSVLAALPAFSAMAAKPILIAAIVAAVGITGFSIYRSFVPVDMTGAAQFFSSCWSCGMFGGIIRTLSDLLPDIYRVTGLVMVPIILALSTVWLAWNIVAGWIGVKVEDGKGLAQVDMTKDNGAWTLTGKTTVLVFKLALVSALLVAPLPRMITGAFIEPVFNMGMTLSNGVADRFSAPENRNMFEACLVATAINEQLDQRAPAADTGAYSPKFRHALSCQLGRIHQLTGIGMTVGWAMLNEAFNAENMHKLLNIPVFPNTVLFGVGALILFLFFMGLVPVPLYFLETIIRLTMNLVMLPLFLLGWTFKDWKILPEDSGGKIKKIVDDFLRDVAGIAMVGVLVVFSLEFLGALFGQMGDQGVLALALETNNSRLLFQGNILEDNSLITLIMAGIFIAFFMTSIPAIINMMFSNVKVPESFYKTARSDLEKIWKNSAALYKAFTTKKNAEAKAETEMSMDTGGAGVQGAADASAGAGAATGAGAPQSSLMSNASSIASMFIPRGGAQRAGTSEEEAPEEQPAPARNNRSGDTAELLPCAVVLSGNLDIYHHMGALVPKTHTAPAPDDARYISAENQSAADAGDNRILWWTAENGRDGMQKHLESLRKVYGGKLKAIFVCIMGTLDRSGNKKTALTDEEKELLHMAGQYGRVSLIIVTDDGTAAPELMKDAADVMNSSRGVGDYYDNVYLVSDDFSTGADGVQSALLGV